LINIPFVYKEKRGREGGRGTWIVRRGKEFLRRGREGGRPRSRRLLWLSNG